MKIFFYITFFFMLALTSCKCRQVSKSEVITKDSLIVKDSIVIRDKVIYSPVDSAKIKALVICPDGKPANIKPTRAKGHKQATAIFSITDGVASVECLCDSTAIRYQERERYKTELKRQLNIVKMENTKEVPYIPKFFWVFTVIGLVATIYGAFKLIYFFK